MTDTSTSYISRVCHAAPFADNDAGNPEMVELMKALAAERDALKLQLDQSRYTYIGKDGKTVLARDLEDERDALRAENEVLKGSLESMCGVFDTPISRIKIGSDFANEARSDARAALKGGNDAP